MTHESGPFGETASKSVQPAVFLSYASEDAVAAERICTSLRAAGIEVWFDRSELRGGDAWDAAIRRQIKNCALFIPIISINSHGRAEGYFRLEWKLAVDRSHLMASDRAFLVPVVIDGTPESDDRVPERFREVQWIRLLGGEAPPAFVERIARLLSIPAAAPARAVPESPAPGIPRKETKAVDLPAAGPAPILAAPRRRRWSRPAILGLLAAALLVAGVAGWNALRSRWPAAAVAPYSIEDRRMTFAVLPFQAPAGDVHGAQVAAATTDEFTARLEANTLWTHAVPRGSVVQAMAHLTGARELARALDVHFLVRGSLAKDKGGYKVDVAVVDGDNERVLETRSVDIVGDALTPRWRADVEDVLEDLTLAALKVEVKRAASKPVNQLDVRDLSFRAYASWQGQHGAQAKDAYMQSTDLLNRALAAAPDDRLATYLTAEINLCDCVMAWSHNVEEQKAIGAAALERYLRMDPTNQDMMSEKAALFQLRGRFEESLLIADSMLERDAEDPDASWIKAHDLLRLGRASEAVPIIDALIERYPNKYHSIKALGAAVHYAVGDYASAARLAQNAATQMSEEQLRSPVSGPVRLTLAAAEAHLGHLDRARAALADFDAAVPNTRTIADIKKWMYTTADLAGSEQLFDGLRLAGVKE